MPLSASRLSLILIASAILFATGCEKAHIAVTTYHYDNMRTGWNRHEEHLKPKDVQGPNFKLLTQVPLDDQVDAQPLVVPRVRIVGGPHPGEHDVVYVATENNTIYAIDAKNGDILLKPNFGPPVPQSSLPGACNNNGPNVGINSTPVIDRETKTLYVIVYTLEAGTQVYRIHALHLDSLTDKMPPVKVEASHTLSDGSTIYKFQAQFQRQRPGLLLANGNVYAGFGSFCDIRTDVSRGWLLGWKAGSLTPLPANQLNDTLVTSPNTWFLSSVWMSGYGVAADDSGSIYFVTGNSDWSGTTYTGTTNIQESVVKLSSDLTTFKVFTPFNWSNLDQVDNDFGSGGALLLPDQPGPIPHLAAAAGKDGNMYLLNRDNLGGLSTSSSPSSNVGPAYQIGSCWCGQSFFSGHGPRIVSSGGANVIVWKVQTSPSFSLIKEATSPSLSTGQFAGFFTSVSSDGDDDAIIWAVSRPTNNSPANVLLYAFDAHPSGGSTTLQQLFSPLVAGTWPNTGGDANIVPVVANGRVFVASNQQLSIFGLQ